MELSTIARPGRPSTGTTWQHRVEPAVALGMTAGVPFRQGSLELRVDADLVRRARIRRDPEGPPLINAATGRSYWYAASVAIAPKVLCAARCLSFAAGAGRGFYDNSVGELRGDVGNYFAPRQHTTVMRCGVETRVRVLGPLLSLQVVDYVGTLSPGYPEAARLSPLHTLIISCGVRLGR